MNKSYQCTALTLLLSHTFDSVFTVLLTLYNPLFLIIFFLWYHENCCSSPPQVAHDVDGLGNYLLLTHRHVAHLHPFSSYLCCQPCPKSPSWVLYHEFTISRDNCIRIASEVHPQMWVKAWQWLQTVTPSAFTQDFVKYVSDAAGFSPLLVLGGDNLKQCNTSLWAFLK